MGVILHQTKKKELREGKNDMKKSKMKTGLVVMLATMLFVQVLVGDYSLAKPKTPAKTNELKGMVIGLDAGHQKKGNNKKEPVSPNSKKMKPKVSSGTAGVATKVSEYELNLTVAKKMKAKLESMGATVVMSRETHDVNISNIERAQLMNEAECDIVIRIHADGSDKSSVNGYSILIPSGKDTTSIQNKSKSFATLLDNSMKKQAKGIRSRGLVERSDLTGFNWSTVPVVLLEMGFMSNPSDDKRMQTKEYQEQLVQSLANACIQYQKASKK